MITLAAAVLSASALCSAASLVLFVVSTRASRRLLNAAALLAIAGGLAAVIGAVGGRIVVVLTAVLASGCARAAGQLTMGGTSRWVHRFAVYAGYAGSFAVAGVAWIWIESRDASAISEAAVLIAACLGGSVLTFAAKTLLARHAMRTMPGYAASLSDPTTGGNWW